MPPYVPPNRHRTRKSRKKWDISEDTHPTRGECKDLQFLKGVSPRKEIYYKKGGTTGLLMRTLLILTRVQETRRSVKECLVVVGNLRCTKNWISTESFLFLEIKKNRNFENFRAKKNLIVKCVNLIYNCGVWRAAHSKIRYSIILQIAQIYYIFFI